MGLSGVLVYNALPFDKATEQPPSLVRDKTNAHSISAAALYAHSYVPEAVTFLTSSWYDIIRCMLFKEKSPIFPFLVQIPSEPRQRYQRAHPDKVDQPFSR